MTLALNWHSGLWCCITITGLASKCYVVQKILSGHTFTNIWTFTVILTFTAVIPFYHRILLLMMLYCQTKIGCKQTNSLEDIVKIVIFWLYKLSLWPWHWRQWTNFSARHIASSSLYTTIPNLLKKWSSGSGDTEQIQSDTWHFNLNAVIPFFHRTLQLMMLY